MRHHRRWLIAAGSVFLLPLLCGCAARHGAPVDPLAEDRRITVEVLRIIAENDELVAEDLRVETRDGVVVISGVQPDLEGIGRLLERAARVRGVTEVVNRIRILRGGTAASLSARSRDMRTWDGSAPPTWRPTTAC
jgi:hypothetical protein